MSLQQPASGRSLDPGLAREPAAEAVVGFQITDLPLVAAEPVALTWNERWVDDSITRVGSDPGTNRFFRNTI
jgi:hypothetical protein